MDAMRFGQKLFAGVPNWILTLCLVGAAAAVEGFQRGWPNALAITLYSALLLGAVWFAKVLGRLAGRVQMLKSRGLHRSLGAGVSVFLSLIILSGLRVVFVDGKVPSVFADFALGQNILFALMAAALLLVFPRSIRD